LLIDIVRTTEPPALSTPGGRTRYYQIKDLFLISFRIVT